MFNNDRLLEEVLINNCHPNPKNSLLNKVYKNYHYLIDYNSILYLESILQSSIKVRLSSLLHFRLFKEAFFCWSLSNSQNNDISIDSIEANN